METSQSATIYLGGYYTSGTEIALQEENDDMGRLRNYIRVSCLASETSHLTPAVLNNSDTAHLYHTSQPTQ